MDPRITKDWIEEMAAGYTYKTEASNSEEVILGAIRRIGRPPPYLTKEVLMMIVDWKAARAKGYADRNDEQFVMDVTQTSISAANERIRIGVLTLMEGVGYRMASTILYFCFPDKYAIMDWRAWNSLRVLGRIQGKIEDTFECWQRYTEVCREIAKQNVVSLRTLDKALWNYRGGAMQ